MTALTRSALKRKAETLDEIVQNKQRPRCLFEDNTNDSVITSKAIRERQAILFPEASTSCKDYPCALPLIFSVFYLTTAPHPDTNDVLKPLLSRYVEVEVVSARSAGAQEKGRKDSTVRFSAYDCSAVHPPVDHVRDRSGEHQKQAIKALSSVINCVKSLELAEPISPMVSRLHHLVSFLENVDALKRPMMNGASLLEECSKALGGENGKRLEKVMNEYNKEFRQICARLERDNLVPRASLLVETRIIELSSSYIRYNLRKLFNGPPPRLSSQDITYEKRIPKYSSVTELVEMKVAPRSQNAAVQDACISAVISTALFHAKEFYGLVNMLEGCKSCLKTEFFSQPDLIFGLKGEPMQLETDQLFHVLQEIEYAYMFLTAHRACNFLFTLFTAPGVKEEVERLGGWCDLEFCASVLCEGQFWNTCSDTAHLALLRNHSLLLSRLQQYIEDAKSLVPVCIAELKRLETRFRTNTKSPNVLHKFPQIWDIREAITAGKERYENVPDLVLLRSQS